MRNSGRRTVQLKPLASDSIGMLQVELDRQIKTPIYKQIHDRLANAIGRGVLKPGDRLPSARSLASHLAVNRGTVEVAYNMLSGEGYVNGFGSAGTVVAAGAPRHARLTPALQVESTRKLTVAESRVKPFRMGLPAVDAFPRKLWSRLTVRHARELTTAAMLSPDPCGYAPLREAIASYLAVSRGVQCSPEQVFITPGFQGGLGISIQVLLPPGGQVWLEDPCYFAARRAMRFSGAEVVGVRVDDQGLDVSVGIVRAPRAKLAYVTPSHQAPLGVSLSVARRSALLSWAVDAGAWIIEDDYDSEFRYGSRPLPALKSLDRAGRVIYVGSFSKVLFPGVRLGYLVVPDSQIDRFREIARLLHNDRPVLNQAVVADFMAEGHFARHIMKMRKLYGDRSRALAGALIRVFGGRIDLQLQAGGMHLLARFPECQSDTEWAARAEAVGLSPAPLSDWRVEQDSGQGLLLSFTNVPVEAALDVTRRLKQAVEKRK